MIPEARQASVALYPDGDDVTATRSWGDLFADTLFTYPMRAWARQMANVRSDAYLYWFTWQPPIPDREKYRAFHAAELGYVFGSLDLFGAVPTDADRRFSPKPYRTSGCGSPKLATQTAQERQPGRHTPAANEAYMELGPEISVGTNLRLEQVALIDRVFAERRAANGAR